LTVGQLEQLAQIMRPVSTSCCMFPHVKSMVTQIMHSLVKLCLLACVHNKTVQPLLVMHGHCLGLAFDSHNDAVTISMGTTQPPPPLST